MGHQLIYTVAKRGVKGQGHCIYSLDEYFPQDSLRNTGYYSKFKLPRTINVSDITNAPAENISLPSAFSYFFDGKYNFFSKSYLGKEYLDSNARPGNFLNHWVILDELGQQPIEKFGSPSFRKSMSVDEVDNSEIPKYLSDKVELINGQIKLDIVQNFIKTANNKAILSQLLSAVIDEQISTKKRTLILVDKFENIPLWIGAILYSFPLCLSKRLSFSTFEFSPNESYMQNDFFDIVGVIPEGTDFRSNNSLFFNVFDMRTEINSNQLIGKYRYPDWAVTNLLDNTDVFESIDNLLLEKLNFEKINKDIDSIISYYEVVNNNSSLERIKDSIRVIAKYGKEHARFQFFEQLLISPMLPDILSSDHNKDIVSYIRDKNSSSQLSLINDYQYLLRETGNSEQYTPYIIKNASDDFILFDRKTKVEALSTVKDIELFQELFCSYLSTNINEALGIVKVLTVARQKKIEPILLQDKDNYLKFIETGISDKWEASLVNNLICENTTKLITHANQKLRNEIIRWYDSHSKFTLPLHLYLSYIDELMKVVETQKERFSILRNVKKNIKIDELPQSEVEKFLRNTIEIISRNAKSADDFKELYDLVTPLYNIDAELFSCVQNQVCRGNVELFVIFLQFIYKNRVFSDQQVESFVIQKDFKKIFENIDKQIIQGKIRVSNRFHKYFTHLKMLNAKSNKFSLFSVLGR